MKKWWIIGIIIVIFLVIVLGSYFYLPKEEIKRGCAKEGEAYNPSDPSQPDKCCEGLKNVQSTGTFSINDKCYRPNLHKTSYNICSNCGNDICEDIESVCGCPEDCIGKNKSDYSSNEEFCDNMDYFELCERPRKYPHQFSGEINLEHCSLCE